MISPAIKPKRTEMAKKMATQVRLTKKTLLLVGKVAMPEIIPVKYEVKTLKGKTMIQALISTAVK